MKTSCPQKSLLAELPSPPPDKTGWPWTKESKLLPPMMPNGQPWPRISIVTPSYNQGQFIEETIRSILLQNYPDTELIIIDGGSTDNTLQVIKKYEKWIAYWISEKDDGQSHALNKGLKKTTGYLIGWQNSDDYYGIDSFSQCALIAAQNSDASIFHGTSYFMDDKGMCHATLIKENFSIKENPEPLTRFQFSNQSMFFHRRIFDAGYFIDEHYNHAMDGEFMTRLLIAGYKFRFIPGMTGICRMHHEAKTAKRPYLGIIENVDICLKIIKSDKTSPHIRKWALVSLREALPPLFYSYKMGEFRKGLYSLVRFGGFRMLDVKFIVRYLVSFLGATFARSLYGVIDYFRKITGASH